MNHVWLMCLKSGVCETYDILWIHINPKISKVIKVTFKHQVGQIWCFLCLPATHTHTQNLWPPLAHMFPDKTDTRWCPSSLAKLVNITPITMVRFMVDTSILTMVIYNMLGIFVVRGLKFHSWHTFLSYGTCSRCLGIPTGDICGHHIHWWHNEAGPQMPVIPSI